jgi:hypothetical protein
MGIWRDLGRGVLGIGASKPEKPGFAKAQFPGRKPESEVKPVVKDTSVFSLARNKDLATETEQNRWMLQHKDEIYKMTRGRVGQNDLKEFRKELFGDKVVKSQDWVLGGKKQVIKELTKDSWKKKEIGEIQDAKENIEVAREMLDPDNKN